MGRGQFWAKFDGSTDRMYASAFTNEADTDSGTISFWIRFVAHHPTAGSSVIMGGGRQQLDIITSTHRIRFLGRNTSGTTVLELQSGSGYLFKPGVAARHVMLSWDLATAAESYMYIDDVDVTNRITHTQFETLDWIQANSNAIGAFHGGGREINAELAEFYCNQAEYVDISIAANRRKFLTSDGYPADLGTDGSTPTGTAPIIYLANRYDTFNENLNEDEGDFTVNGALAEGESHFHGKGGPLVGRRLTG